MKKTFEVVYEPLRVADSSAPAQSATFKPAGHTEKGLVIAANAKEARAVWLSGNNCRIVSVTKVEFRKPSYNKLLDTIKDAVFHVEIQSDCLMCGEDFNPGTGRHGSHCAATKWKAVVRAAEKAMAGK